MWPLRLTDPPIVKLGANSVTRCIGTPAWSSGLGNRAAILTVGCSLSPRPIWPRKPLRCSSAGVWIAPRAHEHVVGLDQHALGRPVGARSFAHARR